MLSRRKMAGMGSISNIVPPCGGFAVMGLALWTSCCVTICSIAGAPTVRSTSPRYLLIASPLCRGLPDPSSWLPFRLRCEARAIPPKSAFEVPRIVLSARLFQRSSHRRSSSNPTRPVPISMCSPEASYVESCQRCIWNLPPQVGQYSRFSGAGPSAANCWRIQNRIVPVL